MAPALRSTPVRDTCPPQPARRARAATLSRRGRRTPTRVGWFARGRSHPADRILKRGLGAAVDVVFVVGARWFAGFRGLRLRPPRAFRRAPPKVPHRVRWARTQARAASTPALQSTRGTRGGQQARCLRLPAAVDITGWLDAAAALMACTAASFHPPLSFDRFASKRSQTVLGSPSA